MKSKDEIISDLYRDIKLKKVLNKMCWGQVYIAEELHAELFLRLLEKDEEYIRQHHSRGSLFNAAALIGRNILCQKPSKFNRHVVEPVVKGSSIHTDVYGEPSVSLENKLSQIQGTDNDPAIKLHDAFREEFEKLHYHPRYLINELFRKSEFDEHTGKWKHVSIKDISQGQSKNRYKYNSQAIRKAKSELRERITENLKKKEI